VRLAIDRIKAGSEKEVHANEFSAMPIIPFRLSRFFCPECGEQVYWRAQGGSHPCQFYHKNKTDTSPECDKRVDGRSDLYVYERVGLPLYLARNGNTFQLNIGFPAIGNDSLSKAASQGIKLKISSSTHSRTIGVNQSNFIPDATTLVPINFVPSNETNYEISIEGGLWSSRKWADYADGFAYAGAIFVHGETGGKKVRRGDSISPSQRYYVLTKHLLNIYREIQYALIGSIRLNNEDFNVYEMSINLTLEDAARYSLINSYFKNHYGVWLLETLPEIFPLWPPVVERDVTIPAIRKNNIYCSVTTGNSEPTVYSYNGNSANPVPVYSDGHNNHTLKLPLYSSELVVSVDRKYVGREVAIHNKTIKPHDYNYDLFFTKECGDALDMGNLVSSDVEAGFEIHTNAKMDVVLLSADFISQRIPLRCSNTIITPGKSAASIAFMVENAVFFTIQTIENRERHNIPEEDLVNFISQNVRGVRVPVPYWVRLIQYKYQKQECYAVVELIERNIQSNKAPIGLIRALADLLRD